MRRVKFIWIFFIINAILIGKCFPQVIVSLPDTVAARDSIIYLPVSIELKDYAIASYEFEIRFDPHVIKIIDVCEDSSLTSQWQQPYLNLNVPGTLIAGGYDIADSIRGTGTLVHLIVEILGEPGEYSHVKFAYCKFHGDYPPVISKNGNLWIHYKSEVAHSKAPEFPAKCTIKPNYPEPFSELTTIRYTISQCQYVAVKIFDITGKQIQTVISKEHQPGKYQLSWNARDRFDRPVPAGVYFCMLRTEKSMSFEKLTVIR